MVEELAEIGLRLKGLRESCDVTREEMAAELEVPLETYERWEETGEDVPISAIYHMARRFGVEFTEILTGTAAKLQTYQVVRSGEGREVDRYPGYHFEDLAWRYFGKIMQPLLVVLDPSDEPAKLVTRTRAGVQPGVGGLHGGDVGRQGVRAERRRRRLLQPRMPPWSALRGRRPREVRDHHCGVMCSAVLRTAEPADAAKR